MKPFYATVLLLLFTFAACDIIEEPYLQEPTNGGNTEETVKKVLLEEFTGHQCPNCPEGANTANQLHDLYGDRFITIAYHAGFFARISTEFPTDYRTSEGNALNTEYGISSYPAGMVNRTICNGNLVLNNSAWPTATAELMDDEPELKISLTHSYNASNRNLSVSATIEALCELSPLKVCIFITEDKLISPQITPEGVVDDYEHNHVFRTSLNGTWGNTVFTDGASLGQEEILPLQTTIDASWNTSNLNIVCFAYDEITGEVLQAEQVAL